MAAMQVHTERGAQHLSGAGAWRDVQVQGLVHVCEGRARRHVAASGHHLHVKS